MHPFEHRFRVTLHDIDAAGVMFYAHYFRHAHDAYEAFMAERGLSLHGLLREGRFLLPLVSSEASYRRPLYHADPVEIRLYLTRLGRTSFSVGYGFFGQGGECCAELGSRHVLIDAASREPSPLNSDWRDRLLPYLDFDKAS